MLKDTDQKCAVCDAELEPEVYALDTIGELEANHVVVLIRVCDRCWGVWEWMRSKRN